MTTALHLITKEELIAKFKEIESKGWIENYRKGNDGAVGNPTEKAKLDFPARPNQTYSKSGVLYVKSVKEYGKFKA